MFGHVEALELRFRADAEDAEFLQGEEDHKTRAERPDRGHSHADELHAEELEAAAIEKPDHLVAVARRSRRREEPDRERAPDTVHAVDRHRANGIVDVDLVEREHREDDDYACDESDYDCGVCGHEVAGRRNRDETRERAVQRHGEVGLAHDRPGGDERGNRAGARGEVGGHRDAADGANAGGVAAWVEAEPADPEEEHAERSEDERVAGNRIRLAVGTVLSDTRAERDCASERDPSADGVDDRRAREVVEAEGLDPALRRLARERAPHPVAAYRVDDSRHDHRVDEIALELDAFRDCARYDRRGGRGEHRLEEEERPVPDAFAGRERRHPQSSPAEPAAQLRGAEHKRCAEDVESERARREVHQVLHHDVRGVLCAGEAGLDEREARLHRKDEYAGDEGPDYVQVGLNGCGG